MKQYQALFKMDNVDLDFDDALRMVARKTIEH